MASSRLFQNRAVCGKLTGAINTPFPVAIGRARSFVKHRLATSVPGVDYAWVDIGIVGEHRALAATAFGLGTWPAQNHARRRLTSGREFR